MNMSELQIGLIAVGFLTVAGVLIFNWLQERKFRRHAEQHFESGHEDVLMREGAAGTLSGAREEPRIEPVVAPLEPEQVLELPEPEPVPLAPESAAVPEPAEEAGAPADEAWPRELDRMIDYVALLHAADPVTPSAFAVALQQARGIARTVRWFGWNQHAGMWEDAAQASPDAEFVRLAAGLQLADRSGPVGAADLAAFCDLVQDVAGSLYAVVDFPDKQIALSAAQELDRLCAEADVLVGVNLMSEDGAAFPATKIRALAEAAGMKLLPDGTFHYLNDRGVSLFSLCNLESEPFFPPAIKHLSTHGVTLLFDVPKAADGLRAFDQMLGVARQLSAALPGKLVDDNRKELTEAALGKIRQQLAGIYARMDAKNLHAGSARVLRLLA